MKKEMFNEKYGLTTAVLEGRKTQTRRIAYDFRQHTCNKVTKSVILPSGSVTYMDGNQQVLDDMPKPLYKIGEEVAIAQSYHSAGIDAIAYDIQKVKPSNICNDAHIRFDCTAGWENKMFVKAKLMPHRIRITNVRVDRLQDISEEDCLKEGIICKNGRYRVETYKGVVFYTTDARQAFAYLIDKVFGKGTWGSNPYVFVYDFELIK